ncbi:glycosyl transferase family 28 [Acuticoccus sediminis]|uniref:Glycosyl transferase family 28 n=1 Tax=Acuticoccus sediminis TaxID=2184697 RepID=A0A8B2NL35_9HYPH|nr:glycosyltransferase [Acuticoccus sediminis]RAH98805.1 glycosyl transferase family 28 [Acuticoccus sediminis]
MIFLTLGTHQPFDRLVEGVDRWCAANPDARVIGQVPLERGSYHPKHFETMPHLHINEYRALFQKSEFIVAHAGMGSIITALCLSRPIVIFPRRADLREQRNDHQLATVRRFRGKTGVHVAEEVETLFDAMDTLHGAARQAAAPCADGAGNAAASQFADPAFVAALRDVIAAGAGPRSVN